LSPPAARPNSSATRSPQLVRLDGLAVRRRRHDNGWSPRDLVAAIRDACFNASGLRKTLTPNQIEAIEEREERISYDDLLLLADGLACDPSDLIAEGEMSSARTGHRLH
jgi:transcriptional regulator with XRE-family HTH domain